MAARAPAPGWQVLRWKRFLLLRKILSEHRGVPELLITRDTPLADLFRPSGVDSLGLIELSLAFEELLPVSIPESDTDALLEIMRTGTVGEIADRLDAYRAD